MTRRSTRRPPTSPASPASSCRTRPSATSSAPRASRSTARSCPPPTTCWGPTGAPTASRPATPTKPAGASPPPPPATAAASSPSSSAPPLSKPATPPPAPSSTTASPPPSRPVPPGGRPGAQLPRDAPDASARPTEPPPLAAVGGLRPSHSPDQEHGAVHDGAGTRRRLSVAGGKADVRVEADGSDERVHESLSRELDGPHIGLEDGAGQARVRRGTAVPGDARRDERLSCHAGWPRQPALHVVSRRFLRLPVGVDKAGRRAPDRLLVREHLDRDPQSRHPGDAVRHRGRLPQQPTFLELDRHGRDLFALVVDHRRGRDLGRDVVDRRQPDRRPGGERRQQIGDIVTAEPEHQPSATRVLPAYDVDAVHLPDPLGEQDDATNERLKLVH